MTLDGAIVFKLKATHGLPLEFTVDRCRRDGIFISWWRFAEEARANDWWDFQTHDEVMHSLMDHKEERDLAINQIAHYVLTNPKDVYDTQRMAAEHPGQTEHPRAVDRQRAGSS